MTFFAFGLNHETAPLPIREAFALEEASLRAMYGALPLSEGAEVILLSTCNRTEVYLYGAARDVEVVQGALGSRAGRAWPAEHAFVLSDEAAVRHLLQVTCGIRSLVLGDAQIFSQVKDAYRIAVEEDRVGTMLHRLVHTAFRTAKRVVGETALLNGAASVSSAAVAAACIHFDALPGGSLEGRRVLLLGAGKMAGLALQALQPHAPAGVMVSSRSLERARGLAQGFGADAVAWEDRYAALAQADLILVTTAAQEPIVAAGALPPRPAGDPPVLLIDIAVPRNVDPLVDTLPGYAVVDLDDLNEALVLVEARRRAELPAAEALCEEALQEFVSWVFHHEALQPAIQAIHATFEGIRRQEVERHHSRLSDLDRAELDRLTVSIVQKILAVPVVRLKSVGPDSLDFARGVQLLHALFARPGCEDAAAGGVAGGAGGQTEDGCPLDAHGSGEALAAAEAHLRTVMGFPSSHGAA